MAFSLTGPETIADFSVVKNKGARWYQRPAVFAHGADRFMLSVRYSFVGQSRSTPQILAFKRTGTSWALVAEGPYVSAGFESAASAGPTTVGLPGMVPAQPPYVPGSGQIQVFDTSIFGALATPFEIRCFPAGQGPNGQFYNRLSVTSIDDANTMSVTAIGGWDFAAPAGAEVYSVTISSFHNGPFACPSYIADPADSDKVVCAYPTFFDASIALCSFNMATLEFETPITGGPDVWGIDNTASGSDSSNDDTGAKVSLAWRASTSQFVFDFQGAPETVAGKSYQRPSYGTYTPATDTWSTPAMLAGAGEALHYLAQGILVGSDNEAHALVIKPTNGAGSTPYEIWHVAIDPDDTINAKDLAANNVWRNREPLVSYPRLRETSGGDQELIVAYVDNNVDGIHGARVARAIVAGAAAPTWSTERVNTSNDDAPIFDEFDTVSVGIAPDGTTPFLFWAGVPASDNIYRLWFSSGGDAGAGWSTPDALFQFADDSAYMEFGPVLADIPAGVGIVFYDLFGVDYDDDTWSYFEYGGPELELACPLQRPFVGVAYSSSLTVGGGVAPYAFAVTGGALPAGLTLDASSGLISGTPTTPGAYSYEITVTDSQDGIGVAECSGVIPCSAMAQTVSLEGFSPSRT